MKLSSLNPQFYRYDRRMTDVELCVGDQATWRERGCPTEKKKELRDYRIPVNNIEEAQCVWFQCPKCVREKGTVLGVILLKLLLLTGEFCLGRESKTNRGRIFVGT